MILFSEHHFFFFKVKFKKNKTYWVLTITFSDVSCWYIYIVIYFVYIFSRQELQFDHRHQHQSSSSCCLYQKILTVFTSKFSRTIYCDFHNFAINSNLRWTGADGDDQIEGLAWKKCKQNRYDILFVNINNQLMTVFLSMNFWTIFFLQN